MLGDIRWCFLNDREKEEADEKPQSKAISETDLSGIIQRQFAALSSFTLSM